MSVKKIVCTSYEELEKACFSIPSGFELECTTKKQNGTKIYTYIDEFGFNLIEIIRTF